MTQLFLHVVHENRQEVLGFIQHPAEPVYQTIQFAIYKIRD